MFSQTHYIKSFFKLILECAPCAASQAQIAGSMRAFKLRLAV
jgi:hypothetical protein